MQRNTKKTDLLRSRPRCVTSGSETHRNTNYVYDETKKIHTGNTRKIPYRVGYSWNKGGRLKELRIRHLARKFLKIWMQKTFGRILPHQAKSHYESVVLRRAFTGWRDDWWTSRREWSLTMRAECHYRYYLYNSTIQSWRKFMSLQREQKKKIQNAQSFADRQRLRLVWDSWEVFTEMKRMKNRMLDSALEQNKLTTLRSVWSLWQSRLQHHRDIHSLEDRALKQWALNSQSRSWLQWKEMHAAARCQREKESKASLHFINRLKRRTLHQWISYVSSRQTKKQSQAVAKRATNLHLMRKCWTKWSSALYRKWSEEDRLQAVGHLARRNTQRRALQHWRAYVTLCREEAERNQRASQHHHHHLLRAGVQGLSLNVSWNKAQRLNNNVAVQHSQQTMISKYWKLWQEHLEEAEDKSFQPLTEKAATNYRMSLLSSCFCQWREKLADQRHMQMNVEKQLLVKLKHPTEGTRRKTFEQSFLMADAEELEHRADVWFAERMLPHCFNSWVEFTLQRRLHKQRRHKAQVYNQQRQYSCVFYTWWGQSEKHKEEMLSERMAILHEERGHMQRAWNHWRRRTEQQINEEEKEKASDRLYLHRLLHKTVTQWKDNSTEIRDRRNREQQACRQGDLCCMRWAVDRWKKFVQSQRKKKCRMEQMQRYHEVKLLKHTFVAWKKHHMQMSQIYGHAEELHRQQTQRFHRKLLHAWRENTALLVEVRLMEQQAQNHFHHVLQLKVFLAWREETTHAVSKRHQQREALGRAQRSINQVRLLQSFQQWRKQTRAAQRERMFMEKAKKHHDSKLLSKALRAWNKHHYQYRKYKVMKRQGILLLRLKMCQTYFEQWKMKLQHRWRESKQTEQALWHWSLNLQAKVLYGWRLWVTEQRRKQEQTARAAQVYRDQLLREGVTCILTYAAHMNDLTTSLTQHSQEQRSRHIQRVVKRCAVRWKQRALCKPGRGKEVRGQPQKKSVTFCLPEPGLNRDSPSDPAGQEAGDAALSKLLPTHLLRRQPIRYEELFRSPSKELPLNGTQKESAVTSSETAPQPSEVSPSQDHHLADLFCLHPASVPFTSTHQSTIAPAVSPSESRTFTLDSPLRTQSQDLLLPPSAFMTIGTQNTLEKASSSAPGDAPLVFGPSVKHLSSVYTASSEETEGEDPLSSLTRELLNIQLDMKSFQHDRKQLKAWQRLKDVLHSWLQTSGKDEQIEKEAICQELKELKERIERLSTELAKRKPTMLLHTERIQHLQTVLHTSRVSLLQQESKEMETDHCVFTT